MRSINFDLPSFFHFFFPCDLVVRRSVCSTSYPAGWIPGCYSRTAERSAISRNYPLLWQGQGKKRGKKKSKYVSLLFSNLFTSWIVNIVCINWPSGSFKFVSCYMECFMWTPCQHLEDNNTLKKKKKSSKKNQWYIYNCSLKGKCMCIWCHRENKKEVVRVTHRTLFFQQLQQLMQSFSDSCFILCTRTQKKCQKVDVWFVPYEVNGETEKCCSCFIKRNLNSVLWGGKGWVLALCGVCPQRWWFRERCRDMAEPGNGMPEGCKLERWNFLHRDVPET